MSNISHTIEKLQIQSYLPKHIILSTPSMKGKNLETAFLYCTKHTMWQYVVSPLNVSHYLTEWDFFYEHTPPLTPIPHTSDSPCRFRRILLLVLKLAKIKYAMNFKKSPFPLWILGILFT